MPEVLLDTSIASFLHDGREDMLAPYRSRLSGARLSVSFQTVEEMWFGAARRAWGEGRRARLERFLQQIAVIGADAALARACARLRAAQQARGGRLEQADAWIVATALHYGLPLLTHDRDQARLRIPELEVVSYLAG